MDLATTANPEPLRKPVAGPKDRNDLGVSVANDKLTLEVKVGTDHDELIIVGPLTEATKATLAAFKLPADLKPHLVLDLFGIKHVNSIGIRDWIPFLRSLETSHGITMKRCSPTFVMARNVIPAMSGAAKIESVSRGYECPSLHYWWVEMATANVDPDDADKEKVICKQCGAKGRPEYDGDEYFRFLSA